MAEHEVQKSLGFNKVDGSLFTRVEMEQQIRDTWKKPHTWRIKANKDYGLSKNQAFDMKPGVLLHWMLDEMIRRNQITGTEAGINIQTYNDSNEAQQLNQRLLALVQTGQAIQPKEGEGIDMTTAAPPPGQWAPPAPPAPPAYAPSGPPPPPAGYAVPPPPPGYGAPPPAPPTTFAPPPPPVPPPANGFSAPQAGYAPPPPPAAAPVPPPPPAAPPAGAAPVAGRRGRRPANAPSAAPPAPPTPGQAPMPPAASPPTPPAAPVAQGVAMPQTQWGAPPPAPVAGPSRSDALVEELSKKVDSLSQVVLQLLKMATLGNMISTISNRAIYQQPGAPDAETRLKELGVHPPT